MKKLIIGAVAFGFAVAAQAAQMKWSYTGTAAQEGYTVYAILGATVDTSTWKSAADIANIGSGEVTKKVSKTTTYVASGTAVSDAMTYSSSIIFAMVSADGKQYALTEAVAPGDTYIQDGMDSSKSTFKPSGFGAFKDFASSPTPPDPIPEPTSAMLLVLGMAGLALKRKRA